MKAIIIDDEKHVRDGLQILAEWGRFGINEVFEATDGEEAQRIILNHQPQIIFTDMDMPRLDGIGLLKWLNEQGIDSKVIVVSGYDDFHYMRNAITFGSFDYILKPIEPDVLNETIERAVKEWKKQEQLKISSLETKKVINEIKPYYWDLLFSNILINPISVDTLRKVNTEFGVNINQLDSTIGLLSLNQAFIEYFRNDKTLAAFTLLNISNEILQAGKYGICFRNVNKENEIVILLWKKSNLHLLKEIQSKFKTYYKRKVVIVIGKTSSQIPDSYKSAEFTMMKYNLTEVDHSALISYDQVSSVPVLHLLDFAQDIQWALQSGSIEQMGELLERIFIKLKTDHILTLEQIQLWENEFEILKSNWLKQYNMNDNFFVNSNKNYWDMDGTFSFNKFKEETKKEFYNLIQFLNDVKHKKEMSNIQEIELYIRGNYEKDITLQDIADRFYLSREYISRRFKQEYKETITNYLTKIRIEKAKELLENPHLKVYEISFKVGYQNEKYFSKVFKKLVGMSPNEYRANKASK